MEEWRVEFHLEWAERVVGWESKFGDKDATFLPKAMKSNEVNETRYMSVVYKR
jgi:hypothetical protein